MAGCFFSAYSQGIDHRRPLQDSSDQGHVRYKFAPSEISKQNADKPPKKSLKKQSRPMRLCNSFQTVQISEIPLQRPEQAAIAISTNLASPDSYAMDLGPDIHEYAQAESSSAGARRATNEILNTTHPQSLRDSPSFKTAITDPSFTTAIEEPSASSTTDAKIPDLRHANSVYKSRPTTQLCEFHEFCYSSQYTRPATEMLMEVSEMPAAADASKITNGVTGREEERQPLLGRSDGNMPRVSEDGGSCCWIHNLWDVLRSA
jgi:hypothetical protein